MKKIAILALSIIFLSCSSTTDEEKSNQKATTAKSEVTKATFINNYAVVWHWKTKDIDLINSKVGAQSQQITDLWKKGIIENAYFETEPKADNFENYPGISFFIKASSEDEATAILDNMIFVKEGISDYKLHAVGTKWLGINENPSRDKVGTRSWVAVWNTSVDHNSKYSMSEVEAYAKEQSDLILALWKEGIIENVYFDIEGTQEKNDITDFVLFINAETEVEARGILDNLPFTLKNIAHYQLFSVGVFWMGEYEAN